MLEIEIKARADDLEGLKQKIERLGVTFVKKERQTDTYFSHPKRDFAQTDEALRIRQIDDGLLLTYKGPKLDQLTKTREEFEVRVADENATIILKKLGFREVATVTKSRGYYRLGDFEIMLDDVEDLGHFIEVEKRADEYRPEELVEFLESLGIKKDAIERKSYLELVFETKRREF
jgi:adenylate cyclase, class 2